MSEIMISSVGPNDFKKASSSDFIPPIGNQRKLGMSVLLANNRVI